MVSLLTGKSAKRAQAASPSVIGPVRCASFLVVRPGPGKPVSAPVHMIRIRVW